MTHQPKHTHCGRSRKAGAWKVVLRDVILFGAALNAFALFHHVLPQKLRPTDVSRYAAAVPTPSPALLIQAEVRVSASPAAAPSPTPAPGDFSATFPALDTGANALCSYQTDTVRIAINRVQEDDVTYFVADVYIKTIDALKTAFAKGTYGKSIYEFPAETADDNRAVFAVTGDYYSARSKGIVIRNGTLYRDVSNTDVCILYNDGEMKTYASENFCLADAIARGVWQAWSFGPPLLDGNGGGLTEFNSTLTNHRHPRSAVGYYAPGHYIRDYIAEMHMDYSIFFK